MKCLEQKLRHLDNTLLDIGLEILLWAESLQIPMYMTRFIGLIALFITTIFFMALNVEKHGSISTNIVDVLCVLFSASLVYRESLCLKHKYTATHFDFYNRMVALFHAVTLSLAALFCASSVGFLIVTSVCLLQTLVVYILPNKNG